MINYQAQNAKAIDIWNSQGWEWGQPISPQDCAKARDNNWDVQLTPNIPVPKEWFLPFPGTKILGLASGGGQQMPAFSILGAECTVMDISDSQLENERIVATREGYDINIVKGDMTKTFPFADASFDLIFHPVSNCYIEDVYHVWRECFRVLRPGGVLLSGLCNETAYMFDDEDAMPLTVTNSLPFNPLKNPAQMPKDLNEDGIQFSHGFNEQIGGQLKAGFVIVSAFEDFDNYENSFLKLKIPSYWATCAKKPE